MKKIEIYTRNLCSYCDRAKDIFKSKNLSFIEYNVYENPHYLKKMLERSKGQKLMPQIFINDRHIGGFDHLIKLINKGNFESMINL
jgi:glutaredoxin 3